MLFNFTSWIIFNFLIVAHSFFFVISTNCQTIFAFHQIIYNFLAIFPFAYHISKEYLKNSRVPILSLDLFNQLIHLIERTMDISNHEYFIIFISKIIVQHSVENGWERNAKRIFKLRRSPSLE